MLVDAILTDAPKGGVIFSKIEVREEDFPVTLKPIYTGICGTDRGIVAGSLSFAYNPHGYNRLVLGHESLCRVVSAEPNNYGIKAGDLVIPMVRRPGTCLNCLAGRSDNCSDGNKHEAGITGMHGFMRSQFGDYPEYLIKVPEMAAAKIAVLTEPAKNVEKAMEVVDIISRRSIFTDNQGSFEGKAALVIGTGSEGFLYAMKCRDYGFRTIVTNRHSIDETKVGILSRIGAEFYDYTHDTGSEKQGFDLVIDTSGDPATVIRFLRKINNNGILLLFGTNGKAPGALMNGDDIDLIVERNITVAGSVDGSRIHYERGLQDLIKWNAIYGGAAERLITGYASPGSTGIFTAKPTGEIKTVISWE